MIGKKLDKFFYFRNVADENDDDNRYDSIMLPVNKITGIRPTSRTVVRIYFEQAKSGDTGGFGTQEVLRGVNGIILLQVSQDTSKEVIKAIIDAANATPADGVIVIADNATTDVDGSVKPAKYIHKNILSVAGNIQSDR